MLVRPLSFARVDEWSFQVEKYAAVGVGEKLEKVHIVFLCMGGRGNIGIFERGHHRQATFVRSLKLGVLDLFYSSKLL